MQFCESTGDAIKRGNRILEREKSNPEKKKKKVKKKSMHSERRTFHPPPSCLAGLASNERGKREKKILNNQINKT